MSRLRPWMAAAVLVAVSAVGKQRDFESFLEAVQGDSRYSAFAESDASRELVDQGRLSVVNQRLKALVPDATKTVIDYFVLGNMLYAMEDEASREYMKKAELLDPDNPAILYERGMHEHRRGDCGAALPYYERFQQTTVGADHVVVWAYSTHCYLRMQRPAEALAAWQKVEFDGHHTGIEKAMYSIFGDRSPHVRREQLLAQVRAGRDELLCDVLHHDRNWQRDWWNVSPFERLVKHDKALAARELESGSEVAKQFGLCEKLDGLSDTELMLELEALGIWGTKRKLPASPALARMILTRLTARKQVSEKDLLSAYEADLAARIAAQPAARDWLDLLAYLYISTDATAKLRELDAHGWRDLHLPQYAESYIAALDPSAPEYSDLLAQAVDEFPNSAVLAKLDLQFHYNGPGRDAALVRFTAAQFPNVANWTGYRLDDYMASLHHELRKTKPPRAPVTPTKG